MKEGVKEVVKEGVKEGVKGGVKEGAKEGGGDGEREEGKQRDLVSFQESSFQIPKKVLEDLRPRIVSGLGNLHAMGRCNDVVLIPDGATADMLTIE